MINNTFVAWLKDSEMNSVRNEQYKWAANSIVKFSITTINKKSNFNEFATFEIFWTRNVSEW